MGNRRSTFVKSKKSAREQRSSLRKSSGEWSLGRILSKGMYPSLRDWAKTR